MKRILSLFDYTGNWANPYKENGYEVLLIDLKYGDNILTWDYKKLGKKYFYGILAAPPCTDFSGSGAQYWKMKDEDGRTNYSCILVHQTLMIIKYFNPNFWVLENPVGRIEKLIPELTKYRLYSFNPCDFGDAYTKKTILYGKFNPFIIHSYVNPEYVIMKDGKRMSKHHYDSFYLPKSKRSEVRSITPLGFAQAFYEANK